RRRNRLASGDQAAAAKPAGGRRSLRQGADSAQHPVLVGELALLQFGVEQFPVDGQLEAAAVRGDELEVADLLFVGRQQLARQTEGLRLVVSAGAVPQFEVHEPSLRGSDRAGARTIPALA